MLTRVTSGNADFQNVRVQRSFSKKDTGIGSGPYHLAFYQEGVHLMTHYLRLSLGWDSVLTELWSYHEGILQVPSFRVHTVQ